MNFEPSLSLCTIQTLCDLWAAKEDDYVYKDLQNKDDQFVGHLECPTCIVTVLLGGGQELTSQWRYLKK